MVRNGPFDGVMGFSQVGKSIFHLILGENIVIIHKFFSFSFLCRGNDIFQEVSRDKRNHVNCMDEQDFANRAHLQRTMCMYFVCHYRTGPDRTEIVHFLKFINNI